MRKTKLCFKKRDEMLSQELPFTIRYSGMLSMSVKVKNIQRERERERPLQRLRPWTYVMFQ